VIYLDSCVLIYAVEGAGSVGGRVREALRRADRGEVFAISPLVVMECLVKPLREADPRLEDDYRATFADLVSLPMPPEVFERAARLRAATGVKTPDALHWAIAHTAGCAELWTGDAHFATVSRGFAKDVIGDRG
jgi:predicted nucleic acid-binding protein